MLLENAIRFNYLFPLNIDWCVLRARFKELAECAFLSNLRI